MRKFMVVLSSKEREMFNISTGFKETQVNEKSDLVEANYMSVKDGAICFYKIGNHTDLMIAIYSISQIVKVLEVAESDERDSNDKPVLRPVAFAPLDLTYTDAVSWELVGGIVEGNPREPKLCDGCEVEWRREQEASCQHE